MNGLVGALQFLTRVPIHTRQAIPLHSSVPWFPVAGGLIGAVIGGVAAGMMELVPAAVAAAVAVLFGVAVTGAFHEDGLADTADAIAGGATRERRMEILDDPTHGSYGIAALCGSIVLRVLCVASLGPAAAFAAFVSAHALGRTAATATIVTQPAATDDGLGAGAAREVRPAAAWAGVAAGLAAAIIATGPWTAALVPAVAAAAVIVVVVARRALGGVTGDVLGAVEQVAECAALIVITAFASRHPVWWR